MEDEKAHWVAEAQRCRRLALSINDPDTVERLNALADEYERRAEAAPESKDDKR
jgi:hypothetical protein